MTWINFAMQFAFGFYWQFYSERFSMKKMSKEANAGEAEQREENAPLWAEYLAKFPPYRQSRVMALGRPETALNGQTISVELTAPPIEIYCDNAKCGRVCFFDSKSGGADILNKNFTPHYLVYYCRHCGMSSKIYSVYARSQMVESRLNGEAIKIGEWPPFGPHVPTKMFSLLGEDRETFQKGRRAESQGMGIGAFAYYRRVVENQKNRLINEIIKVSKKLGAGPDIIGRLESARNETQFHKAVNMIKEGIPDVLRIQGHNPLILLHTALSDGLHDKSDEECLIRATSIRTVMAELAERITQALSAHEEFSDAVSKLLIISQEKGKKPPSS